MGQIQTLSSTPLYSPHPYRRWAQRCLLFLKGRRHKVYGITENPHCLPITKPMSSHLDHQPHTISALDRPDTLLTTKPRRLTSTIKSKRGIQQDRTHSVGRRLVRKACLHLTRDSNH